MLEDTKQDVRWRMLGRESPNSPFHFQFQLSGSCSTLLGCGTSLLVSPSRVPPNSHLTSATMRALEVDAIVVSHHLGARDALHLDMLEGLGGAVVLSHTSSNVSTTENQGRELTKNPTGLAR